MKPPHSHIRQIPINSIVLFLAFFLLLISVDRSWAMVKQNLNHLALLKVSGDSPYVCLLTDICTNGTRLTFMQSPEDGEIRIVSSDFHKLDVRPSLQIHQPALRAFVKGSLAFVHSDVEAAVSIWQQYPDFADYLVGLARLNSSREASIRLYDAALSINPTPEWYVELGDLLVSSNRAKAALIAYTHAINLYEATNIEALSLTHLRIGHLYWALDDYPNARKNYELALAANSNAPRAILGLARIDVVTGSPEAAIELIESEVEQAVNEPRIFYWLARAHWALDNRVGAEEAIDELLLHRTDFAPAWELKGRIAQNNGEFDSAIQAYSQSLLLDNDEEIRELIMELENSLREHRNETGEKEKNQID